MRFERWAAALVAGLAVLIASAPALAGVMSLTEFRLEVRDAILRKAPDAKFEFVGEGTLRVARGKDKPSADGLQLFLETNYARYRNQPDEWEDIVERLARMAVASLEPSAEVTKDNLVVLVRPVEYVEQQAAKEAKLVWRPFAGDFIEIVAIDGAETFKMATADELDPIFETPAAVWEWALANTRTRMGKLDVGKLDEGVWLVSSDSGLSLSVVEDPNLWSTHGIGMTADPAAVFLKRNLLLLADSGDKQRLDKVAGFLAKMTEDPETFSTTIFIRHNGVWSVLEQRP